MKPRDGRLRQTPESYVEGGCSICVVHHMLINALCTLRDMPLSRLLADIS